MADGATSAGTKAAFLNVNVDLSPCGTESKVGAVERSEKTLSIPLDAPQVSILPAFPEAYRDHAGEGGGKGRIALSQILLLSQSILGKGLPQPVDQ